MSIDGPIDVGTSSNSQSLLLRRVPANSRVLEFGPGPGRMTRYLVEEMGCQVVTVERDPAFSREAARWAKTALCEDIEHYGWASTLSGERFDCILFADVLEHLGDPWQVVARAKTLLADDGLLLISVPNVGHASVVLALLSDSWELNDSGLLDRTHLRFFTHQSARALLTGNDLVIEVEEATYRPVDDTLVGRRLPPATRRLAPLAASKPFGHVYQFLFQARHASYPARCPGFRRIRRIERHSQFAALRESVRPVLFHAGSEEDFAPDRSVTASSGQGGCYAFELTDASTARLRFDPCERPCVVELRRFEAVGPDGQVAPLVRVDSNGTEIGPSTVCFAHDDPSFVFLPPARCELDATWRIEIDVEFIEIDGVVSDRHRWLAERLALRDADGQPEAALRTANTAGAAPLPACQQLNDTLADLRTENRSLRESIEEAGGTLRLLSMHVRMRRAGRTAWKILLLPLAGLYLLALLAREAIRAPRRVWRFAGGLLERLGELANPRRMRLEVKHRGLTRLKGLAEADALASKLRTVPVAPAESCESVRLNVLVPTLDPELTFGGYLSLLRFVGRAVARGTPVRLVIGEDASVTRPRLLKAWRDRPEVLDTLKRCDLVNLSAPHCPPLGIHDNDRFLAYSGWMGLLASQLASHTPYRRFVFFIQEYEPVFHANGSTRAVLESVYRLPHVPIFNTAALREHFRAEGLGVYAPDRSAQAPPRVLTFEHAISDLSCPGAEELAERTTRRLLFYARPEPHAERNLFALGLLALRHAVANGHFPGAWEFCGIGTLAQTLYLDLGGGYRMKVIPRIDPAEYVEYIRGFDVGLSLMMAPHPSVLPFEMLAAGMVVVTNTYRHRTEAFFEGISRNLVPCRPDVEGVSDALRLAAAKSTDIQARRRDATVAWNRDWNKAFDDAFLDELSEELWTDKAVAPDVEGKYEPGGVLDGSLS